jgi:flagellin
MSNFSILTNVGAQVALANLNSIGSSLQTVQNQVSTGEKVASATDNAAVFAVAQGIRANLQSYDSINTSLTNGQGVVSVALAGATSISNLLSGTNGITATLTALSGGDISDQQRQTYTQDLKSQIDEIQTFINGSNYNGVNVLAANQGTLGATGYASYSTPANISVLAGVGGNTLTIQAQDLTGGTAGTDGFLGLARLVYQVGSTATSSASVSVYGTNTQSASVSSSGGTLTGTITASQSQSSYQTVSQSNLVDYATLTSNNIVTSGQGYVSVSEVNQNAALAALAAVSNSTNAYVQAGSTSGVASVYGAALANFTTQINNALGTLGADNNNLQLQITFNQSLSDATNTGLGNLVDANRATASAQITALQTQQQLATQALSIANSQPSIILSLFKGG